MRLSVLLAVFALALAQPPVAPIEGDDSDAVIVVEGPQSDPERSSATVTVVPIDERLSAGADVADAVNVAPGTTVRRTGGLGDASGVSIRGGGLRQTLVLIDGVPLNPDGGASVNLTELPLAAFDQVSVYRGGAPAELSAGAMGGVVDLRSATGEGASLYSSFGSLKTARVGAAVRGSGQRAHGMVMVDALRSDGNFSWFDDAATRYNTSDDATQRRENNDSQQVSAHATATMTRGRLAVSALGSLGASEEGVPGPAGGLTQTVRFGLWRTLSSVQLVSRGQSSATTARLWGSLRYESLNDRLGEIGLTAEHTADRASSLGARGVHSMTPTDWVSGSVVLDARIDRYRTSDQGAHTGPVSRGRGVLRAAASAHLRLFDERLSLDPTLSGVLVHSDAVRVEPLPRLAARVELSSAVAIKGQVSRALRVPDLLELYGDRGAIVGNPELRPELGVHVDIGVVVQPSDRVRIEVVPFVVQRTDGIVYIQNSQRTAMPINLDRTVVAGVEAYSVLQLGRLDLRTSLTATHSNNGSAQAAYAGKVLPRTPTWVAEHATGVVSGPVRLGHTLQCMSRSYLDAANQLPSPGRMIHGAFVRATASNGLSAELAVGNLFDARVGRVKRNPLDDSDTTRVDTALTDFSGYPLAGRTVLGSLRWTL